MRTRTVERIEGRADAAPAPGRLPGRLEESFERRSAEFAAAARRVRTGSDPESIHDLRVATRRLVTVLRVWKALVPARARRAAERALRRLRRRIGRARELEVHIALLEERLPAHGATDRSVAAEALERFRERLTCRRRSAARLVSPRRLKRLMRRVETAGAGLGAPRPGRPGAPPVALAVERQLAEQAVTALKNASEHPDDVSLHEARVTIKKWRYTLECLNETVPGPARQPVRPLRRIQGELGDAHDRALLRELLERVARRAEPTDDGGEVLLVISRLELERERAVRRFKRLAATLIERSRDAAPGAPERGAFAAHAAPVEAADPAPAVEPAEPPDDGAAAGSEDAGTRDARRVPRDERWDRMATWLERAPRKR